MARVHSFDLFEDDGHAFNLGLGEADEIASI